MVSNGAVFVLGFCVTLSPMLGIPWLVVLCPLPCLPALVCGFLLKNLLSAARTCGWQPTVANISTPWKAFIRSVKYQMYCGPPTAHEITSATQVTPITITSFMHMRPSVALEAETITEELNSGIYNTGTDFKGNHVYSEFRDSIFSGISNTMRSDGTMMENKIMNNGMCHAEDL